MDEINQAAGRFQLFQYPGKNEANTPQPGGTPNIAQASPGPVLNATAATPPASEPSSSASLTDRKIAPATYPEEGDYFQHLIDPYHLNSEIHLPTMISTVEEKLFDLSLKYSRKVRKAGTDQAARDTFLQAEDLKDSVRKKRLDMCAVLGCALAASGENTEAEKYGLRAYHDLRADSPQNMRELTHAALFTIYDREGESRLAKSFLNKHYHKPAKYWVTGMIALGMAERYRSDWDPLHGHSQFKKAGQLKRDFKTLEDRAYHMASSTDIGLELKHLWKIFYPCLLPVRDINKALKYCSRLIATIKKQCEDPVSYYWKMAQLVALTPESPYYQPLKAVLAIFKCKKNGEAFWKNLNVRITYPRLLLSHERNPWALSILVSSIADSAIAGVSATDLLPADPQHYYDYVDRMLNPLFNNPSSFATEYDQWLEFLEQSEKGERFAKDNGNVLDRGLAALPNDFYDSPAADNCQLPDWIYQSTEPADWSINSIRYLFAIDLPKNPDRARQYAGTFRKILPEKGAILEALVHLEKREYQRAFDVLDLPESNHPGVFLFRADILRKHHKKMTSLKLDRNELIVSIVSNYVKAGEKGLPIGYVDGAEFLMEKYPGLQKTWEEADSYYRLAAKISTETFEQQRNLIMAELCQAEAELIKPSDQVRNALLPRDAPIQDKEMPPGPQDPDSPRKELPARASGKVKADQQANAALTQRQSGRVEFWKRMKEIYSFMDNNELLEAEQALERLPKKDQTEPWIKAMVAQNKAWCGKLMLEERMFSAPQQHDRKQQKKSSRSSHKSREAACQSKPLLTRSELVDKGLQHLREGFKALGIELQSLERVLTVELKNLQLSYLCERQYLSLLSTLAHYYSHGAEVSMSRKLRELYRKLYTRSHEIRDRISV